MGKIASVTLYDASGTRYAFIAYPLDSSFANDGAVYVFSQRTTDATGKGTHKLIYIGETGELGDSIVNHEKWPCIRQYGANCICVHPDADAQGRLRKEADLIQNYSPPLERGRTEIKERIMADETIEPQLEMFKILTMIDNRLTNIESELSAVHDIRDLLAEIRNELKR